MATSLGPFGGAVVVEPFHLAVEPPCTGPAVGMADAFVEDVSEQG